MEKQGKVIRAKFTGRTWDSNYGKMYDHEIEFDNGDSGIYASKSESQNKLIEGTEATYEILANGKFPSKIKPVLKKDQPSNGNAKEYVQKYPPPATTAHIGHGDLAASALACATRVYVAKQQMITGDPFTIDQIFPLADRMLGWLKERE